MSRPATTHGTRQALLLLVSLVGALLATPAAPAGADTCDGVWVVVDASDLGGGIQTRCAAGDPESGLQALEMAGFSYTFVPRHPGMVCTIDGRPDPCNNAPSDAHWSYWTASAGGEWSYSSKGAGNRDPEPGTVDGWSFGAGDPPGTPPPADEEDEEPDVEEDEEPTGGDDAGGDATSSGDDGGSGGSTSAAGGGDGSDEGDGAAAAGSDEVPADEPAAGTPTPEASETADVATASPAPTASTATDDETEDPRAASPTEQSTVDVVSVDEAGRSGGDGALGLVAGGALVAAVAAAAVLRARRRPDAGSVS